MSVSSAIRMAVAKKGMNQATLAKSWGVSAQAINNKFYRDSWSAEDLQKVADITGGRLMFVYPDGQQILIEPPAEDAEEEKES